MGPHFTPFRTNLVSGDEEADLLPHFQKVFPVLLDLIASAPLMHILATSRREIFIVREVFFGVEQFSLQIQ